MHPPHVTGQHLARLDPALTMLDTPLHVGGSARYCSALTLPATVQSRTGTLESWRCAVSHSVSTSCPSGLAARAEPGAPTIKARTARARACRRMVSVRLAPYLDLPRHEIAVEAGTDPTCMVTMAFPLRSRTENAKNVSTPLSDRHGVVLHAQRTTFF